MQTVTDPLGQTVVGSWLHIEATTRALVMGGPHHNLISTLRDISERKQHEIELLRAREELEGKVKERTAELERLNEALELENSERQQAGSHI